MGNTASASEGVLAAALKGDAAFISERMKESRDAVLSARTGLMAGKRNLLHIACKTGQREVLATIINPLLDAVTVEIESQVYPGPATAALDNIINQQDSRGRTALLAACYYGMLDCAQLLLEAGSNIFACDKDGNSVLHLAAIKGHTDIVISLLAKADAQAATAQLTTAVNLSGFTPLHYAAYKGSTDIVRQLAVAGVDLLQASWGYYDRWMVVPVGSTALHVAAMRLKASACLALLEYQVLLAREWRAGSRVPIDPRTMTTAQGLSPYDLAIWKGMPAACQLATVLNPCVPVQAVVQQERLQALEQLRRKGPVSLRIIAAEAAKHYLLLQLAALTKQHQQQKKLQEQQQQQHCHQLLQRRQHAEGHHSPLCRVTNSRKQLANQAGPDDLSSPSTEPTPAKRGVAVATAVALQSCQLAGRSCSSAVRRSTSCSSVSSCSQTCCSHAAVVAATRASSSAAQVPINAGVSVLPGAIAGPSFTEVIDSTALMTAVAGPEQGITAGLVATHAVQQQGQLLQQLEAAAGSCKHSAPASCEIEAETADDDYCTVRILSQSNVEEKGELLQGLCKQPKGEDASASLLHMHMLTPGSLVASSWGSSSNAAVSVHNQYAVQRRRGSKPAIDEGNKAEATGMPSAVAASSSKVSGPTGTVAAQQLTEQNQPSNQGWHSKLFLSHDGGVLESVLSRNTSGILVAPSSSSRMTNSRKPSFQYLPQLDLSRVSRGAGKKRNEGSAVFSANREHYLHMMQEAHVDDPGALSYRALTRHNRTGSMTAATALAGALPGCVSDRLAHCYDESSFIAMHMTSNSISSCQTAAQHTDSAVGGRDPSGITVAGGTTGSTAGSTIGCMVGGTIGSAVGGTPSTTRAADSTRRVSACSSLARGDVCAVCMDQAPTVGIAGCGHELCLDCAKCIVSEGVGCRPALCPFCRQAITGFELVVLRARP